MISIGNMLKIFFCVNYEATVKIFKNKDYPFFSTVLALVIFEFFTLLFIIDFVIFQILERRDILLERNKVYGIIFIL
ncbi:hypothetical protein, partial [Candidatus Ulvibacter alkanivorans]|uniref:hypothetical protein n=1 Tax=Candidatus Ulvibacter alkanivorans TaxID=2267620 RepID=UPI001B34A2E5